MNNLLNKTISLLWVLIVNLLLLASCGNVQPVLIYETTIIKGSMLSVVQLCPGIPVQYPTSFPEQALCIDNILYGVMWMGGNAWLSPLPPGDYRSTSPQGCSLVVLEGCKIQ